jgi:phosphoribosylaminoimidazole-succinocarboxamide synthase
VPYFNSNPNILYESQLASLPLLARGKVRDIYAVGKDKLLIVTTDRLSAFDVIMSEPIPGKGQVLNQMTNFWLHKLASILPNHLTDIAVESAVAPEEALQLQGRATVVKRLQPIPIEAVVRGYLAGSGWQEYCAVGEVCGVKLPAGLKKAQRLPRPIFTPAAKASSGQHDENITYAEMERRIGMPLAAQIRAVSLRLYRAVADEAASHGMIIADTKFEFGLDERGVLHLIDEVATPDSSRFWPAEAYAVDMQPPSFDKQFVRDWLATQAWNKKPPAPRLPPEVISKTAAKYHEALARLTGCTLQQNAR